jgi:hypothetical protein
MELTDVTEMPYGYPPSERDFVNVNLMDWLYNNEREWHEWPARRLIDMNLREYISRDFSGYKRMLTPRYRGGAPHETMSVDPSEFARIAFDI